MRDARTPSSVGFSSNARSDDVINCFWFSTSLLKRSSIEKLLRSSEPELSLHETLTDGLEQRLMMKDVNPDRSRPCLSIRFRWQVW
tara:strand:- start:68 stop:325 length:258 start_codon:yes stop_codon:yes gene_type:complete